MGCGRSAKNNSCKGVVQLKKIQLLTFQMFYQRKIYSKEFPEESLTKKSQCKLRIPYPHNFSNGPSFGRFETSDGANIPAKCLQ